MELSNENNSVWNQIAETKAESLEFQLKATMLCEATRLFKELSEAEAAEKGITEMPHISEAGVGELMELLIKLGRSISVEIGEYRG